MGALDLAFAANFVDASVITASYVASSTAIKNRLMTANGSGTANGTELGSSGGYAAGASAPSITFAAAVTTTGSAASSIAVTVTNMPATTAVGVELWDNGGTPHRKWWGALTAPKTTNSGDTYSEASGAVTLTAT